MDYIEDHAGGIKFSSLVKKMGNSMSKAKTKLQSAVGKNKSTNPNRWQSAVEKMKKNAPSPAPVDVPSPPVPPPGDAPVVPPPVPPAPTPGDAPVVPPPVPPAPTPGDAPAPPAQQSKSFFNKLKSGISSISSRIGNPLRRNRNSLISNNESITAVPDNNVTKTAVQNPNVIRSSDVQKQNFVKSSDVMRQSYVTSDTKVEPEIKSKPPPIVKKEPTVVYYNDALDTFTYIIVVLIISFFIFIILKDLYRSLKLYYSNIRIPKVKMNMFDGKTSYNDDNQFDSNDYRNNNWTESIKYMMDKKNQVLEDEFSIIREFKEINKLPSDLHTSISIANIKDSDDEYEYNKKDGQSFVEALFTKPKHYKYLNNSDFRY
jgi:hypothetical protein